jgi:DNA-binding NtrC family response regulator
MVQISLGGFLPLLIWTSYFGLGQSLKAAVEEFEERHIAWVLRAANGNREHAARMLEVDPATLYRRLAKYGLQGS